jgi:hypothetical protein
MDLLIAGMPTIDLEDWQANTDYMGFLNKDDPQAQWFWEILREEFSPIEHAKLMHFTSGSASVPASGFSTLSVTVAARADLHLKGGLTRALSTCQLPPHASTACACLVIPARIKWWCGSRLPSWACSSFTR